MFNFKKSIDNSLIAFKTQNFCSRLYKKDCGTFFNKLSPSFVNNNKLFWKTFKTFF